MFLEFKQKMSLERHGETHGMKLVTDDMVWSEKVIDVLCYEKEAHFSHVCKESYAMDDTDLLQIVTSQISTQLKFY